MQRQANHFTTKAAPPHTRQSERILNVGMESETFFPSTQQGHHAMKPESLGASLATVEPLAGKSSQSLFKGPDDLAAVLSINPQQLSQLVGQVPLGQEDIAVRQRSSSVR